MYARARNDVHARGFGLIELMIALLLGLIVVGAITSLVVGTLRANSEAVRMTQLTQDLRSVMTLVTRDVRRAGYWPFAIEDIGTGLSTNPHAGLAFDDDPSDGLDATCILFSFHEEGAGGAGSVEADERQGFRYDQASLLIEAADPNSGPTDCIANTGWIALTDDLPVERRYEITEFGFTTVGGGAFQTAGNVTVREIVITVEGRLAGDPDVTRRIRETIRVRNDLIN